MNRFTPALVAALLATTANLSHAAGTIDMVDNGTNVVATASGSFDTTELNPGTASGSASVYPALFFGSALNVGGDTYPASTAMNVFAGIAGPTSFGGGSSTFADQSTGDRIGLISNRQLQLPFGYTSGTPLFGTATWQNQSLDTLGVTAGSYTWTWGSGAFADSLTLNISVSAVPEPQSVVLMLAGLAALATHARRRRRQA